MKFTQLSEDTAHFVVVIVDWENADVESVSGPFASREQASAWADQLIDQVGWDRDNPADMDKVKIVPVNRA